MGIEGFQIKGPSQIQRPSQIKGPSSRVHGFDLRQIPKQEAPQTSVHPLLASPEPALVVGSLKIRSYLCGLMVRDSMLCTGSYVFLQKEPTQTRVSGLPGSDTIHCP